MKKSRFLTLLIIFSVLSSCFGGGVDKRGSVKSYKDGLVTTRGGLFKVGQLSNQWFEKPIGYKAILFKHRQHEASITVDAFCKGSFDDSPLHLLAQQLFYNLERFQIKSQKKFTLDDRQALRTIVDGKLDGAPVTIDSVVLKKNECVFDFVLTTTPEAHQKTNNDFENFFGQFQYVSGP